MRLRGEVALVTGGGRGIGASIAMRFAAEGAAVAVADRNAETAGEVARAIRRAGGRAVDLVADIADERAVAVMAREAAQALGPVHAGDRPRPQHLCDRRQPERGPARGNRGRAIPRRGLRAVGPGLRHRRRPADLAGDVGQPSSGSGGLELEAITAAFLGACAMSGGRGATA